MNEKVINRKTRAMETMCYPDAISIYIEIDEYFKEKNREK